MEQAKRVANYLSRDSAQPSYWKGEDDNWYLHLPDGREDAEFDGLTANLASHKVEEHDDGTISATPSILVTQKLGDKVIQRHGYLTRGVWNEC
jgi:hypothetical protein